MTSPRDALITGVGLVSCLGEGIEAHWAALNHDGGFQPVVDSATFAPWLVHPMTALELDRPSDRISGLASQLAVLLLALGPTGPPGLPSSW